MVGAWVVVGGGDVLFFGSGTRSGFVVIICTVGRMVVTIRVVAGFGVVGGCVGA